MTTFPVHNFFFDGWRLNQALLDSSPPPAAQRIPPLFLFFSFCRSPIFLRRTPFAMQRNTYGQSPPLHHPVPQHVSTVPQLRSPPPPPGSAQSHQGYGGGAAAAATAGNPYQQQGGANGNVFGQYGQFMNDPTAQVAAQFGQTAFKQGQEYMEQNVSPLGVWQ